MTPQFEKILVLSRGTSWRTKGLKAAASLTNITIEIPPQPYISPLFTSAFEQAPLSIGADDPFKPNHGSTIAWLAHLDLLKYAYMSKSTTILILEDDIDWDLKIKTQMQLLSDNIRQFFATTPNYDETPYSNHNWDVLWIGHCGDVAHAEAKHHHYDDNSRITTEGYNGWSKGRWIESIPEAHRRIQHTAFPLRTWAYAVTLEAIPKILKKISSGGDAAFDRALRHYCTDGSLRCVSVLPEIMGTYKPRKRDGYTNSEIAVVNGVKGGRNAVVQGKMGSMKNIVSSARCAALFGKGCTAPGARAPAFIVGTGKGKSSRGDFWEDTVGLSIHIPFHRSVCESQLCVERTPLIPDR